MAMARTFSSDNYEKMLSNPKLNEEQKVTIKRMRDRRKTKEGEHEYRAYMKQTLSRKNVFAAQEERDTLKQLKERKEWRESWDGTAELKRMQETEDSDAELAAVQAEIAALKASLGIDEYTIGAPAPKAAAAKTSGKYAARFSDLTEQTIDEQAKRFLMTFVFEFQGRFEEVLDLSEAFKGYCNEGANELEEDKAHMFLEARGETCTVTELRDKLRTIDIDCNLKISFIEFLFFKFEKTLNEFFEPPDGPVPEHLLAALEEAISWHTEHWGRRHERDSMYEKLEAEAEDGGRVSMLRAKAQLKAERSRGWTQQWNAEEIHGAYQKRKAETTVKNADKTELLKKAVAEENARLAKIEQEQAKKMREERLKSRAKLAAKAAMWQ